ncbi:TIGR04255 family protein [Herbaspirillum seropedicae]|uniref:TIGR04255 family protein n=1 Tax=Herbaspirillum seropedicae TaxID=964 RepID=UPI003D97405C
MAILTLYESDDNLRRINSSPKMSPLPTKLKKEPLIDVVFEIRFQQSFEAATVLPGLFFGALGGTKIEKLGSAEIPSPIRNADPNMAFAPLIRVTWDRFLILIGERSVSVGCVIPYPGWASFKSAILQVLRILQNSSHNFIDKIQRYSMKYVDFIPSDNLKEQLQMLNMKVDLGGHHLTEENFQLRVEIPANGYMKMIQIISNVEVIKGADKQTGLLIDVDIASDLKEESLSKFMSDVESKLDAIHILNKKTFFDCLTQKTITSLEPEYE